jgi:hypothetical protein
MMPVFLIRSFDVDFAVLKGSSIPDFAHHRFDVYAEGTVGVGEEGES